MKNDLTILYIDDEPLNLILFESLFEDEYTIITANNAIEAIDILRNKPEISIVISDYQMPYMNGYEFVCLSKKEFPHIPFFILSSIDVTDEIINAIKHDILKQFLRKPFRKNEINEAIQNALVLNPIND